MEQKRVGMKQWLVLVGFFLSRAILQDVPGMPGCDKDIPCQLVKANDLIFQCRVSGPVDGTPVILLHGFPEYSIYWLPQMQYWVSLNISFRAVACDLRGYSPLATPPSSSQYSYSHFQADTWAIADAFGFKRFHLIGHDHGAGLGWTIAANKTTNRIASYSALSVPHPDAFSGALYGASADPDQVYASNYFNQYAEPDSAQYLWPVYKAYGGPGFPIADSLQPPLWWYFGSIGSYIARPPVVLSTSNDFLRVVQEAMPLPVGPGAGQTIPTGDVNVPVLFVCGKLDPYLLCTRPYVDNTTAYVPDYSTLTVDCGHDVVSCDGGGADAAQEALRVHEALTQFILAHPII